MFQAITANELPIPIGDNQVARVPFPMTEEDFDLFIGTLNLWKKKLVKKPEQPPPVCMGRTRHHHAGPVRAKLKSQR